MEVSECGSSGDGFAEDFWQREYLPEWFVHLVQGDRCIQDSDLALHLLRENLHPPRTRDLFRYFNIIQHRAVYVLVAQFLVTCSGLARGLSTRVDEKLLE